MKKENCIDNLVRASKVIGSSQLLPALQNALSLRILASQLLLFQRDHVVEELQFLFLDHRLGLFPQPRADDSHELVGGRLCLLEQVGAHQLLLELPYHFILPPDDIVVLLHLALQQVNLSGVHV